MNRIRPEEMISVRNRRYPSGIDRIRCLKPLTFVIDVMNVDGGDERLIAYPDAPIQNGSSSFRWQNETRSNLPNLADTNHISVKTSATSWNSYLSISTTVCRRSFFPTWQKTRLFS